MPGLFDTVRLGGFALANSIVMAPRGPARD
jgi:hypothetical protein